MASTPITQIKIYGERNTGTNYLERVLRLNFAHKQLPGSQPLKTEDLEELTAIVPRPSRRLAWEMALDVSMADIRDSGFGWKHGVPPWDVLEARPKRRESTLFIVLSKHPADWVRSMHRKPYHCMFAHKDMELGAFMRQPWICMSKDGLNLQPHLVAMWNAKYRAWLDLANVAEQVVYLRYNDLLTGFEDVMARIAVHLGPPKSGAFRNLETSAKGEAVSRADYVARYTNQDLYRGMTPEDVAFLRSELDAECLAELGYALQ